MDDNKSLLESVMLDAADAAMLSADLSKIRGMIDRAARAIGGRDAVPAEPDDRWLRMVPESDPAAQPEDADTVTVRHEISDGGTSVVNGTLTVPRVVG